MYTRVWSQFVFQDPIEKSEQKNNIGRGGSKRNYFGILVQTQWPFFGKCSHRRDTRSRGGVDALKFKTELQLTRVHASRMRFGAAAVAENCTIV